MYVLGIESSTSVASVALVSQEGLRGEMTLNIGLTHSEQLLPLLDDLLQQTKTKIEDISGIAVSGGPGSFTGLRIGMSTAKGLAQGRKIPLVSVPTLMALAYQLSSGNSLVSPMMNARKKEIYTGLFHFIDREIHKLEDDQAVSPYDWVKVLEKYQQPVILTGDGASFYRELWQEYLPKNISIVPDVFQVNRAASVAWLGRKKLLEGAEDSLYDLKPVYIRPPEAQLKKRRELGEEGCKKIFC